MSQPYVGEIRMFAGNFAPAGWNFCDGTLLAISQYDALFNLIGTTYGGNGQSTFGVPDLRGRIPIHQGNSGQGTFVLGANGGTETVTLNATQIPSHTHPFMATANNGNNNNPSNQALGAQPTIALYIPAAGSVSLAPSAISSTGGSQPHNNFQPYLCINFIISLFGVYPNQS
jgi:microcystin-dependent protein